MWTSERGDQGLEWVEASNADEVEASDTGDTAGEISNQKNEAASAFVVLVEELGECLPGQGLEACIVRLIVERWGLRGKKKKRYHENCMILSERKVWLWLKKEVWDKRILHEKESLIFVLESYRFFFSTWLGWEWRLNIYVWWRYSPYHTELW